MNEIESEKIILYTSRWCGQAVAVERLLSKHNIAVERIDIGQDDVARETLIALNNGYASVPTLIFPDGTQMTEPPLAAIRAKLGIESPSFVDKLRTIIGSSSPKD